MISTTSTRATDFAEKGELNMKAIFAVINTTWTVVKTRPENNSGLCEIWTHDLYDAGAALYQLS